MKNWSSYITVAYVVVALLAIGAGFKAMQITGMVDDTAAVLQALRVSPNVPVPVEYRENSDAYKFTNPILYIETDQGFFREYDDYDAAINGYIKGVQLAHKAEAVSVYFRDMNSGHWTGENIDEKYEPSSMLKVVLMIAQYRKALTRASQSSSTIDIELSRQLYYPGPDENGQYYTASEHLEPGNYSVQELIDDMIINSDNAAMYVLINDAGDEFTKAYKDFRFPAPANQGTTDYMTARSYSVAFRTLYNSTYLPWDMSEKSLQLLSTTAFTTGLVSGVPASTTISHKFGEHTNILRDGALVNRELHDCGIVYYPGKPYLICVMTRGQNFPDLAGIISTISKMTYDYVDRHAAHGPAY